jgi:hypothetical protein
MASTTLGAATDAMRLILSRMRFMGSCVTPAVETAMHVFVRPHPRPLGARVAQLNLQMEHQRAKDITNNKRYYLIAFGV